MTKNSNKVDSSWNMMAEWQTRGSERETGKWSGQPVFFTLPWNMVYPALLPLMHTPRLPVVDWTDAPTNLNELVRFTKRWNLVSARVPSHFKCSLLLVSGSFTIGWRALQSRTLLFTRWHGAKSLEDVNPPRPRLLLQGSDTMRFGANQMKYTITSHKAIPSHHHDNLADHGNYHASELIRIMCEGKIWFGRLQAYQLVSVLLHDTRGVSVPQSLPITITITSDRQGYSPQHLLYSASTHYINQSNIQSFLKK